MLGEKFLLMVIKKNIKNSLFRTNRFTHWLSFPAIDLPRTKDSNGDPLPSARMVSNLILSGSNPVSSTFTTFLTHFGQFIDHDVISTPSMTGRLHFISPFSSLIYPKDSSSFSMHSSSFLKCKIVIAINVNCKHTVYTYFSQRVTRLIPCSTVALRTCKYLSLVVFKWHS